MRKVLVCLAVLAAAGSCEKKEEQGGVIIPSGDSVKSTETLGQPLTSWTAGTLDIHFINTTTGECTFCIFPDGTTMLVDAAGSLSATGPVGSTSNTGIRARWDPTKDSGFRAGAFIADYIKDCLAWTGGSSLDYVVNTHFHADHMGGFSSTMPLSDRSSTYRKQSLPEVLDLIQAKVLLDRGWPDYNYPFDVLTKASNAATIRNYVAAVKWHVANTGLKAEMFKAGASSQISLQYDAASYPTFKVQNIAVNGNIWDGSGTSSATATFPALKDIVVADPKNVGNADCCPEENHCTTAFKISYGKFDFYHAGDAQYDGCSTFAWKDMETPAAKACGTVDVMKADHHGVGNTNGHGFVAKNGHVCEAMKYLNPRCWIVNSWTDGHPRQVTYEGVTGYVPGMDIFITNVCDAMTGYNNWSKVKSSNGHIVVRVARDGKSYFVYTLTDSDGKKTVKNISGPYYSK